MILTIALTFVVNAQDCPASTKNYSCKPICYKDSDCASIGGKCCPNMCNQKSCVERYRLENNGNKYDKNSKNGGTSDTVYCGNVKCSAFERCEIDRITKREKCVRK